MTETEQRYAQIEKEVLATTWVCEMYTTCPVETDCHPN